VNDHNRPGRTKTGSTRVARRPSGQGAARLAPWRPQDGDAGPVDGWPDLQALPSDPSAAVPSVDDSDAAEWSDFTTPDGRHGWQRVDAADLQDIEPEACPVCGGLLAWWDLAGKRHCERCSPRTAGLRLRELTQRRRKRCVDASIGQRYDVHERYIAS
jgi:hypothetical protein